MAANDKPLGNLKRTSRASGHSVRGSNSAFRKSKSKGEVPETKDKKQLAKEQAANREHLLASRNAAYVINYLEKRTHFDKDQIRALQKIYRCFKGSSKMDRLRFRAMISSVLGITDGIMLDRIFQAFDGDNEGQVSETEWIMGLSVQLRGSLEHQIAYVYDVYDINGDRSIGRDEITSFLRNSVIPMQGILEPEEVDEALVEMVELTMKKFDLNRDGNIQFAEFRQVVRKDPLLLEIFGECLPHEHETLPFMALLDANPRSYNNYLSRPGDIGWSSERERYKNFKEEPHTIEDLFTLPPQNELNMNSPPIWSNMAIIPSALNNSSARKSFHISKPKANGAGTKSFVKGTKKAPTTTTSYK